MLLKYFVTPIIFRKKIGSVLSSQWLRLFYQVKELISCKKNLLLKLLPSNVFQAIFSRICKRFRTTAEKLAMENYVLAFHRANKDHTDIL